MKQETLEQAIKYYAHNNFDMHDTNNYKALEKGFEAGAKWQQERSYSYKELLEILASYADWSLNGDCTYYDWLKQFKNK